MGAKMQSETKHPGWRFDSENFTAFKYHMLLVAYVCFTLWY